MWSIIVHGGAGKIADSEAALHQDGCRRAARAGRDILAEGGSAIAAVIAAVRVLEDDPTFNAGIGGACDEHGVVMTDAAIMRGSDLAYGAAAAVTGIRNPIELAEAVLRDGKHALLVGPGALAFARRAGVARCDPRLLEAAPSRAKWWGIDPITPVVSDTVGAVALDASGEIVAGTSTGGILGKYGGRVGDAPIAGAGTYARSDWGGISATGHGETMLRTVLGFSALQSLAAGGPVSSGVSAVLRDALDAATARVGGRGGLIAVRPNGACCWARNTAHMGAAWISEGAEMASVF